ncbi:MAG: ATP synthase subunit I [Nitrospirae bacterium]|nr:ATP synthase subunit I [Candidatus Manganitrophaceae bacterium]
MQSPPTSPPPFDRERFLARSNQALHRIERNELIILAAVGLITLLFFGMFGGSMMIGGVFGMFNFRSLHRMFQRRLLDPSRQKKEQLAYSLKVFLIVGLFFYIIQWQTISIAGILIGFFMITSAVVMETLRK